VKGKQLGATAVEFALVLLVFLTFFFGITDFARMLFTWGAANEAARHGARSRQSATTPPMRRRYFARMRGIVPEIGSINLAWDRLMHCGNLRVGNRNNHQPQLLIGYPPCRHCRSAAISMPTFSTTLPVKS